MSKLLEKRNTIYGICALWIVLFHVFRRISMPYIPVLTNIIGIGNLAVDIFFFFSGLCLSLSVKKHNYQETGWSDYFKRRFSRILLPYLIICIPYYLWSAAFESNGSILHKIAVFLANITSFSFWLNGRQTTWYVYGILVFYLLFPILYKRVAGSNAVQKIVLVAGTIVLAILTSYIPVVDNSMILWARLPIFTIGIIIGTQKVDFRYKTKAFLTFLTAFILIAVGFITSCSELSETFTLPPVLRFLLYIPMTLAFCTLASLFGKNYPLLEKIGRLSLEVYLIHITLLHPLKYYGLMDAVGNWLYLLLPLAAVLMARMVGKLDTLALKKG